MIPLPILFIAIFALVVAVMLLLSRPSKDEKATLARAEAAVSGVGDGAVAVRRDLLLVPRKKRNYSGLVGTALGKHLNLLIKQGAVSTTVNAIVGFSALSAFFGFVLSAYFLPILGVEIVAFSLGALSPYGYLRYKRAKRLSAFNKYLPEAIELLTRAIRAGRALADALSILGDYAREPVRTEFAVMRAQIRYGLSESVARMELCDRIPVRDLRFLMTAVMIQGSTGGDLTRVLERTTYMIRERTRIAGEVKTKTAQGRLSGIVLILMPIGLALAMKMLSPSWLDPLLTDPVGHYLLAYAAVSLTVGATLIQVITKPRI